MAEAQVQLEMSQFKACLDDAEHVEGIQSDIQVAETVGVTETPSVYIKGVANTEKWYKLTGTVTTSNCLLVWSKVWLGSNSNGMYPGPM